MTTQRRPQGVLIDLDGTLFHGTQVIPGAVAFISELQKRSIPLLYWTNNSTRTPASVADHLCELGFSAVEHEVFTSSQALVEIARSRLALGAAVHVVGESGLRMAVADAGFRDLAQNSASHEAVEAVFVGLDRKVTYAVLAAALKPLLSGAWFLASNNDRILATEEGFKPGAGAILSVLETAAGREAEIAGKPSAEFVLAGCKRLRIDPAETLVVGDNLATDIAAGVAAGAMTAWVRTGVPDTGDLAAQLRPTIIIDQLQELLELI